MRLRDVETDRAHDLEVRRVLIVAWTGRDEAAVARHVAELAEEGIPTPDSTPVVYEVDPGVLTQSDEITVVGDNTSGEVEAVLVVTEDAMLLTVGSDHTDRELERMDILASKATCPKVVGHTCVDVAGISDWDGIRMTSHIDDGQLYQDGSLADVLPLQRILAFLADRDLPPRAGDVVYLGTIPSIGGIRPADRFIGALVVPGAPEDLGLTYSITVDHALEA